jgi:hypothetical protein
MEPSKLANLGFSEQSIKVIVEEAKQVCNQEQKSHNFNKNNAL